MPRESKQLQAAKQLMAALGRMPPKPHAEMKLKTKSGKAKSPASKRAKSDRNRTG